MGWGFLVRSVGEPLRVSLSSCGGDLGRALWRSEAEQHEPSRWPLLQPLCDLLRGAREAAVFGSLAGLVLARSRAGVEAALLARSRFAEDWGKERTVVVAATHQRIPRWI
jgi:hypothetical protein